MDDELKAEVERVLELDAKRTQGEWRVSDIPWSTKTPDTWEIFYSEFDECVSEIVHKRATADFIAYAPQMAETIRQLYELCQKQEAVLNKEVDVEAVQKALMEEWGYQEIEDRMDNFEHASKEDFRDLSLAAIAEIKRQQMEEV